MESGPHSGGVPAAGAVTQVGGIELKAVRLGEIPPYADDIPGFKPWRHMFSGVMNTDLL